MRQPFASSEQLDLSPADAVSVGLRAYGFVHEHRNAEVAEPITLGSAALVAAIDQLIRDDELLGRFSARTGFALEITYAARRHLSIPGARG
jgi:hypothetical protein